MNSIAAVKYDYEPKDIPVNEDQLFFTVYFTNGHYRKLPKKELKSLKMTMNVDPNGLYENEDFLIKINTISFIEI